MEYLKQIFLMDKNDFSISMMGKIYFPSSIHVEEYYDLDQVKTVTVKFVAMHHGKESVIGFSGSPCDVSQIIQHLRKRISE